MDFFLDLYIEDLEFSLLKKIIKNNNTLYVLNLQKLMNILLDILQLELLTNQIYQK